MSSKKYAEEITRLNRRNAKLRKENAELRSRMDVLERSRLFPSIQVPSVPVNPWFVQEEHPQWVPFSSQIDVTCGNSL